MRRALLAGILVVAALAYGFRLGFPDFWGNHWESRRALIARTMVESGDYVVPRQNGEITLNKPPLYYWTVAAAMKGTGDHGEAAARLPSAAAGVLGLALVARVAWLLGASSTAAVAAALLLGNILWFGHARTAEMDLLLAVVELGAMWAFLEARGRPGRGGFAWLGWAGIAAGFLIKGPVGILVPAVLLIAFRIGDLGASDPPRGWVRPWRGLALFALLVLPWFAAVAIAVPEAWTIFRRETLTRYAGGLDHHEPFWFYLPVVLGGFLPGSLFLPLWVREAWRGGDAGARTLRVLGAAILVLLVFFSLSGSKRVYYVLPLWPWLAAGCAIAVDRGLRAGSRRWIGAPVAVLSAVLLLAGLGALAAPLVGAPRFYRLDPAAWALLAGIALLGLQGVRVSRRGRWDIGLGAAVGALTLAGVFIVQSVGPVSNGYRSRRDFLEEASRRVPSGVPIYTIRESNFANPFYARRTIPDLPDLPALRDRIAGADSVFVLAGDDLSGRLVAEGFHAETVLHRAWSPPGRENRVRSLALLRVSLPGLSPLPPG